MSPGSSTFLTDASSALSQIPTDSWRQGFVGSVCGEVFGPV